MLLRVSSLGVLAVKSLRTASDPRSSAEDVLVSELRSASQELSAQAMLYSRGPDKKFYMSLDMKYIDSPEFHQNQLYPYDLVDKVNQNYEFHTPMLNSINLMMPSQPLLYHDNSSIQVLRPSGSPLAHWTAQYLVEFVLENVLQ